MLSSQINFYILPEEIQCIQQWAVENHMLILKVPIYDLNDIFVPNLYEYKTQQVLFTLEKWIKHFEYRLCEEPRHRYFLEHDKELIIEFTYSFLKNNGELPCSRFFFTKQYYDSQSQSFIKKDEEYVKWAMKVYRDFKKRFLVRYETNPGYIDYVTPLALEKHQKKEISFAYY